MSHTEPQNRKELTENEIGQIVVDCAVRLHKELGPGLLESVYETILAHELQQRGLTVARQVSIPIVFHGIKFNEGFRADILVEDKVVLEIKSVEASSKSHKKQALTHLRLSKKKLGYVLNFGAALMKEGISRIINGIIT
jgi:GxxExxY protein